MTNTIYFAVTDGALIIDNIDGNIIGTSTNSLETSETYWVENNTEETLPDICMEWEDGIELPILHFAGTPETITALIAGAHPAHPPMRPR